MLQDLEEILKGGWWFCVLSWNLTEVSPHSGDREKMEEEIGSAQVAKLNFKVPIFIYYFEISVQLKYLKLDDTVCHSLKLSSAFLSVNVLYV